PGNRDVAVAARKCRRHLDAAGPRPGLTIDAQSIRRQVFCRRLPRGVDRNSFARGHNNRHSAKWDRANLAMSIFDSTRLFSFCSTRLIDWIRPMTIARNSAAWTPLAVRSILTPALPVPIFAPKRVGSK